MNRDIELLFELGMLRHMPRQWSRFNGIDFAKLADHHFRVIWIALVIAGREKQKVNTEKVIKMALVHDVAESRASDVDYVSRQYVERNEELAAADMFTGTILEEEFLALLAEYEERTSLESQIVKDADNLDVDMEIQEQESNGVKVKNWLHFRDHVAETKLYTKTAKKMYQQIKEANPHSWHMNSSRNRVTGGDWKK